MRVPVTCIHSRCSPQVFIGGEFVGGSDILYQMHQEGELEAQLKTALEAANKA